MLGARTKKQISVTHIVGPGPHAIQTRNRFCRDGQHAKQELDRLFAKTNGQSDYIGEWHCHPVGSPPSPTDRVAMQHISRDLDYATAQPVLVIVQRDADNEHWSLSGFAWSADRLHPRSPFGRRMNMTSCTIRRAKREFYPYLPEERAKQHMNDRREFLAEVIQQGWKIASADDGFVELETGNRWQMTGWFVGGRAWG